MNEDHPDPTPQTNTPPVAPGGGYDEEASSKKILCGVLAIVLGGLGIHKFLLGYTSAGVIMLVVYALGFMGGCVIVLPYLLCFAMSVIGVIEGIIYLTKPAAEFRRVYMDGKKEWF